MVAPSEMKRLIERWKRGTRALRIDEQEYGRRLVGMLENYDDRRLAAIGDPLEAAAFIVLTAMIRDIEGAGGAGMPDG